MPNTSTPLPEFEDPPVIETVLSVEFAPLEAWKIPQFGLFWNDLRTDYPRFEIQPPLATPEEARTKEDRILQAVLVEFMPHPLVRCWYIHADGARLLQVQSDRFIHNWRKGDDSAAYPRYDTIRPMFEREWARFVAFLTREKLGAPEPMRCEVTYVNHLVKGREWNSLADLAKVFAPWSGRTTNGWLPAPNGFAINVCFPIPEEKGSLTIQTQMAVRKSDKKDIVQMTLTARGRPASPAIADVLNWLDLGREWVVRGFADFTSPDMHKLWRRKG